MLESPQDGASKRSRAKRRAILEAGIELFRRYGFRKASIDAIAAQAEVAKPTIYAYFDGKESLFEAVCGHVLEQVIVEARRVAASEAPIEELLTSLLIAKFSYLWDVVHASPHAAELLAARTAEARAVHRELDKVYRDLLVSVIRRASRAGRITPKRLGLTAPALASLLMQGAYGARYSSENSEDHRKQVARFVAAFVRGMIIEAQS